jgi:SP family xylose:H+ symportor-like MFS transporter
MVQNTKSSIWSFTIALAGFLFGFDTVVISGANQPIKELWDLSPLFHGTFIMSMALWGTVIGALLGGYPSERFGRKPTLFVIGLLFLVSALGSAMASGPYSFSFFRFIGGLGVGASSVAAPAFISEIAIAQKRGRLVAQYQFNIVLGILIAFVSNYLLDGFGGSSDWRWMLGVEAIPAAIYCLLVLSVPESPRWLITQKNNHKEAKHILNQLFNPQQASEIFEEITQQTATTHQPKLFSRALLKPLSLAFLLAFFNQWSGINFILYYAPEILERAGLATQESLLSSVSIGGINLLFTLFGMYLIDVLGRKQLLLIGSVGYIISLSMVAYAFYSDGSSGFLTLLFMSFYCITRYRSRSGNMGTHCRIIPECAKGLRTSIWFWGALGFCSPNHLAYTSIFR